MSEPNLKKNYALSTVYQILTMLIPFITAPYISRILGADGVGIYSYTNSIQMYFSMFAALGTVSYGSREIARHRNNKEERSQLFWEIETLTVLTSFVCLFAWGIFVLLSMVYKVYYAILTFALLATLFDISWFYIGMEQFKYTVAQNSIFKILGVIALFLFVKKPSDVHIYILIMALTTLLGNMSMWIYLPKFIIRVPLKTIKLKRHFKETLAYFIPTIATSVYTVLDKTLIGLITKEDAQNGYYEQATKIINMAKTLTFSSLNSVLGARISYLFAEKRIEEIKRRIHFSMQYILFMGIGICFGLIAVSKRFVPLFFGAGYEPVIELLYLLSPIVIIIGISNCLGSQYYNPAGLRTKSAKYIIVGSVVNLIFNLILIPLYQSKGAVVATLIAECIITILYMCNCNKYCQWSELIKAGWKKLVAGIMMLVGISTIDGNLPLNIMGIIIILAFGIGIYCITLFLLKDNLIMDLINKIRKKVRGVVAK